MALDINYGLPSEELMDCAHCGEQAILLPYHLGDGIRTKVFIIECLSPDCYIRTYPGCVSSITRSWNRRDG